MVSPYHWHHLSTIKFKLLHIHVTECFTEHGICDIQQKITSPQNMCFVVHDSRGFEPGAVDHLNLVKTFLQECEKAELKDQVHAIWQVSSVGYRYLLKSVSGFVSKFCLPEDAYSRKVMKSLWSLVSKVSCHVIHPFGKYFNYRIAPIVVVSTQFDKLLDRKEMDLTTTESDLAPLWQFLKRNILQINISCDLCTCWCKLSHRHQINKQTFPTVPAQHRPSILSNSIFLVYSFN